jgi:hypothetical protein
MAYNYIVGSRNILAHNKLLVNKAGTNLALFNVCLGGFYARLVAECGFFLCAFVRLVDRRTAVYLAGANMLEALESDWVDEVIDFVNVNFEV